MTTSDGTAEIVDGEYTTETPAASNPTGATTRGPVDLTGQIQTWGAARKLWVRVRLKSGTGDFLLTAAAWSRISPTRCTSSWIKAPLVAVERVEAFDIAANLHGGGPVRPGRRAAPGDRPRAD